MLILISMIYRLHLHVARFKVSAARLYTWTLEVVEVEIKAPESRNCLEKHLDRNWKKAGNVRAKQLGGTSRSKMAKMEHQDLNAPERAD